MNALRNLANPWALSMRLVQPRITMVVACLLLTFTCTLQLSAQIEAAQSGNWNNSATWVGGVVPTAADDVVIAGGRTVTVNAAGAVCNSINVGDNGAHGWLTFSGTSSLTVSGQMLMGDALGGTGTLTMHANASLTCGSIAEGDPGFSGFYYTDNGTISFTGNFTLPDELFQFGNLVISSGTTTLGNTAIAISGNFTIDAGATMLAGATTLSRNTTGGTLTINGILKLGGTQTMFTNFLTHSFDAASTVHYYGASQTVAALNSSQRYGNLVIEGTGTKQIVSNIELAGNLSVNAGIFNLNTYTANRATLGGTLTLSAGTTLRISGGSSLPSNFATHSLAATSTTDYRGTSAQTIATLNGGAKYGHLSVNNSVKTLAGDVGIAGNLIFGASAQRLELNGYTLTLEGNLTGQDATKNFRCAAGSNLVMQGTANRTVFFDQSTPGTTNALQHFTINHLGATTTLGNDMMVTGQLSFTNGKLSLNGRTVQLNGEVINTVAGGLVGSTTSNLELNGTNEINLSFDQTTDGSTNALNSIYIGGDVVVTLEGHIKIDSELSIAVGTLNLDVYTCNRIAAGGTLTIGENAKLQIGGTNGFPINYTTHILENRSTVEYAGTNQAVAVPNSSQHYSNLVISGSGVKTMTGSFTVDRMLTFDGGKLAIDNYTLIISGRITNTVSEGLRGSSNSNLTFDGTLYNVTISMDQSTPGTTNVLKDITLNSGSRTLTLGNSLRLVGSLDPVSGKLASGGFLTLASSASGTARVGSGSDAGGYVTGEVTVERYISAGRKWHLLSVATTGSQTIHEAWQEGAAQGSSVSNGYGAWITSAAGDAMSNGFDAVSNGPSIQRYVQSSNSYQTLSSTYEPVANDEGIMIWVRGDRGCTSNDRNESPTILCTTGLLRQGDQTAVSILANKAGSINNSYPSAIDFRMLDRSASVNDVFYVWDPRLSGSRGWGAYQTFTYDGSNYTVTPGGGSYGAGGSICNTIESGQAFLVATTGGSGTVQLLENAKTSGSRLVSRPARPHTPELRISLKDDREEMLDGVLIKMNNNYNNGIDKSDAPKLMNFGESISVVSQRRDLAVNYRKQLAIGDTVFVGLYHLEKKQYAVNIHPTNLFDDQMEAFWIDDFTGTAKAISLGTTTTIVFEVTEAPRSAASNRFYLVFRKKKWSAETITKAKIAVMSNPIIDRELKLKFSDIPNGVYSYRLYNDAGQLFLTGSTTVESNFTLFKTILPNSVKAGKYNLIIRGRENFNTTLKLVVF